jgi:hypothetical protein
MVQGGVQDPEPNNNTATDTDAVLIVPDLALQILDPLDPFDPSGTIPLPYRVLVSNGGPADAHAVVVDLTISALVSFPLPTDCVATTGQTIQCNLGSLAAGASRTIDFVFTGLAATTTSFSMQGLVTTVDADPLLANNAATQTTQLLHGANVRVTITDGRQVIPTGYRTVYQIRVENIGSLPAGVIDVAALIAPELVNAGWTCTPSTGVSCGGPATGNLVDSIALGRGQSVVYALTAYVDPNLDVSTPRTVTQQVSVTLPPGVDINLIDNAAQDQNSVTPVLYADGFEDGLLPTIAVGAAVNKQCAAAKSSSGRDQTAAESSCRPRLRETK